MCIIVDTNQFAAVFRTNSNYPDLVTAISKGRIRLVYGGRIISEYNKAAAALKFLLALKQRGSKVVLYKEELVSQKELEIIQKGLCKSQDQHVLGLAVVSGARLLCTQDENLMCDFRNPKLLQPKGKIYMGSSQNRLLTSICYTPKCTRCKRRSHH